MTKQRDLYEAVYDWGNLLLSHRKASRGKRGKPPAAEFEYRLEENLIELQDALREKTYRPGAYHSFYIHDPKKRLISAAPFRDRVVHHALCNVIEPILEQSFIYDSYANRLGKGTHRAIDRAQYYARRFKYVLPCDVKQYFPSIDHQILRIQINGKIRNRNVMWLVDQILESGVGVLGNEYEMVWFPGDDLFAINRPRGLPIGNLTSQFWANCYLNGFDHFVKRDLCCKGYVRYVDDMLLFSNSKVHLWQWKRAISERMAKLRLTIHEKRTQVRRVRDGIPFLGFVVFPHKRRLKRRKGIAYNRKLRNLVSKCQAGKITEEALLVSVKGWLNHIRYGDTTGLQQSVLDDYFLPNREESIYGALNPPVHQNL